ncbi:DNA polymerase IV [[Clostridium] cellulosi]|jgi:impB/mucB/samB family./impB/mucB/samB family C-terminal.|uniref:DNA polymerase IV n=1 Tax=[Clostridium] cellulosi TaxID=29343 RepID=A0A078KTY3_9FIRM|nr:MAG: DNA polymerase IV [[Clostridium] cellulosi]CDZ24594.1 DNA polymerase IV [[Clostridium] cellulosi]
MERVILHCDMNSFYASVECLYHPELRDKPVAVCGDVEQRHGIILTKNQIAKKYGVSTGEAIWQAKKKCPELVTLNARYDLYIQFSKAARKIYERYTDRVESFGLDECWLDLSGIAGFDGDGEKAANELRNVIKSELGITASVGVSWNKIFAKLGSDLKKPDAVTVISKKNYKDKIFGLPASDLLYVGPATTRKLARYGIHTIGDIAESDSSFLRSILGKWGEMLWSFANGLDLSPVARSGEADSIKSIGNSMTTYRDIENADEAWKVFTALSESVAERLRKHGLRASTLQISVRDNTLSWFERQTKLERPCCTAWELSKAAMDLFLKNYNFQRPLRSLGVRACDLTDAANGIQLNFFENTERIRRRERLEASVDAIRSRFGHSSIVRASLLGDDLTYEHDPLTHVVHPVSFLR